MINQYPITDIIEWIEKNTLITYPPIDDHDPLLSDKQQDLIITIINQGLIPPIYIGTNSQTIPMSIIRRVYRGTPIIKAIHRFASNSMMLDHRAPPGLAQATFNTLARKAQMTFLTYQVPLFELHGHSAAHIENLIQHSEALNPLAI